LKDAYISIIIIIKLIIDLICDIYYYSCYCSI